MVQKKTSQKRYLTNQSDYPLSFRLLLHGKQHDISPTSIDKKVTRRSEQIILSLVMASNGCMTDTGRIRHACTNNNWNHKTKVTEDIVNDRCNIHCRKLILIHNMAFHMSPMRLSRCDSLPYWAGDRSLGLRWDQACLGTATVRSQTQRIGRHHEYRTC